MHNQISEVPVSIVISNQLRIETCSLVLIRKYKTGTDGKHAMGQFQLTQTNTGQLLGFWQAAAKRITIGNLRWEDFRGFRDLRSENPDNLSLPKHRSRLLHTVSASSDYRFAENLGQSCLIQLVDCDHTTGFA